MATKDVLDLDLPACEGLEKLGNTQEMARVRVVRSSSFLVQVDGVSVRRRVAWSIFFSVSSSCPALVFIIVVVVRLQRH